MTTDDLLRIEDATPFHASADWKMGALALGAAAAIVWGFGVSLAFDVNAPDFNPAVFVPVILAAYGGWQLLKALGGRSTARRFGATVFEMQGRRLFAGETLRGRVLTERPVAASGGFHLRLRGIESRRIRETAGVDWRDQDVILWEAERTQQTADSSTAGIAVEFAVPADATSRARGGPVRWTLEVRASTDEAPFTAWFGVPIWTGDRPSDVDEAS